jgi:16S rRNA (cytosine967-C5)-methyltransferase
MKQAARVQSAIDILEKISEARIPMDNTIRDFMAHKRYIGSKDRKFIVELVYNVMRSHARLGWWLTRVKSGDTPRSRVLAYLVLTQQDITNLFTGEKHQPDPLSSEEKDFVQSLNGNSLDHDDMPENILCECPDWAADKLKPLWGDDFKDQMLAMLPAAVMDLRVNTIKVTRERAQEVLAADNVETVQTPYSPVGLRAVGKKPYMSATKAFHKGLVEIQDEGSQLIALLCDPKPGMRVLDYCAGSGGKTLGIAAMMEGKGIIYAMDNNSRRLEKGRRRYKKAGVHNVEVRSLEDEKNRKWLRRQKGAMDIVLVDAPCTSSGTWRRNPDYRWNIYGPSLEEIVEIQAEILARVADKVKPGGRLVYATCSLFPEENEKQIENFLLNHPEYKIISIPENYPSSGDFMRLTPKDHSTDGFFTAVLERQ